MPQQGFDRKGKVGMFYSLICLGKYEENDYNTDSQLCLSRRTKIGARSFSSSLVTDVCLSMLLGRLFLCRWLCSCHVWYCSSQLRYKCHFFFKKRSQSNNCYSLITVWSRTSLHRMNLHVGDFGSAPSFRGIWSDLMILWSGVCWRDVGESNDTLYEDADWLRPFCLFMTHSFIVSLMCPCQSLC